MCKKEDEEIWGDKEMSREGSKKDVLPQTNHPMDYQQDKLTEAIIQSIIQVHQTLGPGFLENVYRRALLLELRLRDLAVETEKEVIVYYQDEEVGRHRLDLVVENKIIVELKTVDDLSNAHYAQVRSYLKATGLLIALLVNFAKEKAHFRRIEKS